MRSLLYPFVTVGGALVAVVAFVVKAEYKDWGRRLARAFVAIATSALPEPERSLRREEWVGELVAVWADTQNDCTGLAYAWWLAARYGTVGWAGRLWSLIQSHPGTARLGLASVGLVTAVTTLTVVAGPLPVVGLLVAWLAILRARRATAWLVQIVAEALSEFGSRP